MDDMKLFMVYSITTEQYYGPNRSAYIDGIWMWADDVDDVIPWLAKELEKLCKLSDGHERIGGIEKNNIIIVPICLGGLDFRDSIPLTQWCN